MTINSALLAGVTGLTANASALAGISENIANANTIGYKRVGVNFADLVNSSAGSSYSAGGLTASIHNMISQQGTITASSSATDLAISGGGFFVTTSGPGGGAAGDSMLFTRAGSFNPDKDGYLRNSAGLYLQGWPIGPTGAVMSGAGADSLTSINLLQFANSAQASSKASVSANLNADLPATMVAGGWDVTDPTKSMAKYAASVAAGDNPVVGVKPDFSTQITVNDSKGGSRNLIVDYLKDATNPNLWHVEVRADPASDLDVPTGGIPGLITSGDIEFNTNGTINTDSSATHSTLLAKLSPLDIGASSSTLPGAGQVQWAKGLGLADQPLTIDLAGLTQLSGASATNKVSVDGTPFGSLSGVSVDDAGMVTAIFANGSTRQIAQLAIATFTNPDGMSPISGDAFGATGESGSYSLKAAGTGGAGKISPSSLEASTVDLSTEFTGLITTQRAYSACSKIITTADQMLEQLLAIKQ